MPTATASVIVATLNEERNIGHVLEKAGNDPRVIEIIVADGGSRDRTREIVESAARTDIRVRLIDNPDRHQSAGLNRAGSIASGDYLVRMDAHTRYAPDYVTASLDAVQPDTAVGGPMRAEGDTPWSRATANAMGDPLAIGPARFHHATEVEQVDTVYLGSFFRIAFLRLGGFRTFPSGTVEDTDFYTRWRDSGRSVVVDPKIESHYTPRATWKALARQYLRYGLGKGELIWLNGRLPSLRPLAPALLILALIITSLAALVWSFIPLGVLMVTWLAALGTVAARASSHRLSTALVAATMHLTYGAGLWLGILQGKPTVLTLGLTDAPSDPGLSADTTDKEHE